MRVALRSPRVKACSWWRGEAKRALRVPPCGGQADRRMAVGTSHCPRGLLRLLSRLLLLPYCGAGGRCPGRPVTTAATATPIGRGGWQPCHRVGQVP